MTKTGGNLINCEKCTHLKAVNNRTVITCVKGHLAQWNSDCPKLFSYNSYKTHGINKSWLQESCVDYDPEVFDEEIQNVGV